MKKIKGFVLCVLLCMLLLLSGCQLALPHGDETQQDRLIGVFLTWEYLELFDHEAFLDDQLDRIVRGKDVSTDSAAYQGRLYATQQENRDFVFEGVEGMNYFVPLCTDEQGNTYHMICVDGGISGGNRHIHSSDEGESLTLTGTIYVAPQEKDRVLYENPVYQMPDGQVYALQGSGMGFAGGISGFSFKTEESSTMTDEQGNTKTSSISLELTIEEMLPAERITLLQMNDRHEVLKREHILPEDAPESIAPDQRCAYLILETETGDGNQRQLIQRKEEGFEVYALRPDGVMAADHIQLLWQE